MPGGMVLCGRDFHDRTRTREDGRWIAEVTALPGVLCYGQDRDETVAGVQALALRVIAERLENREAPAEFLNVTFQAACAAGPPPKRGGFSPRCSEFRLPRRRHRPAEQPQARVGVGPRPCLAHALDGVPPNGQDVPVPRLSRKPSVTT